MWTIEQFRIAVLIGSIAFMALLAVACFVGQAIQIRRSKNDNES